MNGDPASKTSNFPSESFDEIPAAASAQANSHDKWEPMDPVRQSAFQHHLSVAAVALHTLLVLGKKIDVLAGSEGLKVSNSWIRTPVIPVIKSSIITKGIKVTH
jgi:hypothetical protein